MCTAEFGEWITKNQKDNRWYFESNPILGAHGGDSTVLSICNFKKMFVIRKVMSGIIHMVFFVMN